MAPCRRHQGCTYGPMHLWCGRCMTASISGTETRCLHHGSPRQYLPRSSKKSTLARSPERGLAPTHIQPRPRPLGLAELLPRGPLPLLPAHGSGAGAVVAATGRPAVPRRAGGAALLRLPRQASAGLPGGGPHPHVHAWRATGLGVGTAPAAARAARSTEYVIVTLPSKTPYADLSAGWPKPQGRGGSTAGYLRSR